MAEFPSDYAHETESTPELDKGAILDKLFEVKDRLGIDVEEGDLPYLLGEDDNAFLGNLAGLIAEHPVLNIDDFCRELGIATEYEVTVRSFLEIMNESE